jgi:hypothetical protein
MASDRFHPLALSYGRLKSHAFSEGVKNYTRETKPPIVTIRSLKDGARQWCSDDGSWRFQVAFALPRKHGTRLFKKVIHMKCVSIHPKNNQDQDQQAKDENGCCGLAKRQTGIDRGAPPPQQAQHAKGSEPKVRRRAPQLEQLPATPVRAQPSALCTAGARRREPIGRSNRRSEAFSLNTRSTCLRKHSFPAGRAQVLRDRWLLPSAPCGSKPSKFVTMNTYAWGKPLAIF